MSPHQYPAMLPYQHWTRTSGQYTYLQHIHPQGPNAQSAETLLEIKRHVCHLLSKGSWKYVPRYWGDKGPMKQQVKGTPTSTVIRYKDTPLNKCDDICHSCVICKVQPNKDDPNRTQITVIGGSIFYPDDVATPTGSLEIIKLMINSLLLWP